MRKYIIFKAESMSASGWEDRMLAHTQAITDILCEQYDSSDSPLPQLGDRPLEFHSIEGFSDPQFPDADTHYRAGDWEVTAVEEYPANAPQSRFDVLVICYCKYAPIKTALIPAPKITAATREEQNQPVLAPA